MKRPWDDHRAVSIVVHLSYSLVEGVICWKSSHKKPKGAIGSCRTRYLKLRIRTRMANSCNMAYVSADVLARAIMSLQIMCCFDVTLIYFRWFCPIPQELGGCLFVSSIRLYLLFWTEKTWKSCKLQYSDQPAGLINISYIYIYIYSISLYIYTS